MELKGYNYIGNDFRSSNLFTKEKSKEIFCKAPLEQVQEALELAKNAALPFRTLPVEKRADLLDQIRSELEKVKENIIEIAKKETSLPQGRVEGEFGRTINQISHFSEILRNDNIFTAHTREGDQNSPPKPLLKKALIGLGPVMVFGASNFPLAFSTAGGDTISALAAGNPVIYKTHPGHPGTNEVVSNAIVTAIKQQGLPSGIFSAVNVENEVVGNVLKNSPVIKAVAFTGSQNVGLLLLNIINQRKNPVPFFAEMGSINPVLVFDKFLNQDTEAFAQQFFDSYTLSCGQFCTKPGIIFVKKSEASDKLTKILAKKVAEREQESMLNEGIYNTYKEDCNKRFTNKNVKMVSQSESDWNSAEKKPKVYLASVSINDFQENQNLQEEIFGPFSMIVEYNDESELVKAIENMDGQLTVSVYGTKVELTDSSAKSLLPRLAETCGRLNFASMPTGVEVVSAMNHGGPFPSTTDPRFTSVGSDAILRFLRPVTYQNWPEDVLESLMK